ncbi:MAG: NUDIX domain-containing protein [Bacteroidota bacterium]
MYRIFKDDCEIFLIDNLEFQEKSNFYLWDDFDLRKYLHKCNLKISSNIYLYHPEIETLWKEFKNNFKLIEAAGGIVFNSDKEILFIYRNDKWDLPKGKIEPNEELKETAIREVREETGIINIEIEEFVMCTYHIYTENDREILKVSNWYQMKSFDDENSILKPQIEEGITKVVWKNKNGVQKALQNTYPNIKILIENSII